MDQEIITKGIISGIVDHYIRDISQDPHRSVRKLLDMAERTSDGPTQKICYQMMQKMAENQSSPYYEMIHHLVSNTDPQTIKQFGINLGHNAWTFGSGNIRRLIEESGISISWAVLIDRAQTSGRIPFADIENLINRGRKTEIYAWLLMGSDTLDEWDDYTRLFHFHQDSVFGLCVLPGAITEEILEEAAEIPNLMILINTDEPDWQLCAEKLSRKGILFSAFRLTADKSQAEEILSGEWLEDMIPFHPLMAFSIAGDTLAEETAQSIKEYIWNTRLDQVHPIVPSDLISDFVIINRLITHRNLLYRVNADGSVSAARNLLFESTDLTHSSLFIS